MPKKKIPFRVKMKNGSIETIPAYSEKQALFLASRIGKIPLKVVGIFDEKQLEMEKKEEKTEELIKKLDEALKNRRYLDAIRLQTEIHKAISEGKISWNNNLERKYKIFNYRLWT